MAKKNPELYKNRYLTLKEHRAAVKARKEKEAAAKKAAAKKPAAKKPAQGLACC